MKPFEEADPPAAPFVSEAIEDASTLPASWVREPAAFERIREAVLARTWHVTDETSSGELEPENVLPFTFLEGSLDEPLLRTRGADGARSLLSNVCTHRGNLLVQEACAAKSIRCRYHGRSFGLDGRFKRMPAFEDARDFPRPEDDLPKVPSASLGRVQFASVEPSMSFAELMDPFAERLSFVPWSEAVLTSTKDYRVRANWLLYCDNYLEGFHIPFVHEGLLEALEFGSYAVELGRWSSLQVGIAKRPEDALVLPERHPDHGRRVGAYYLFLFPGTMINVYPWGVSVNAIRPLGLRETKVTYWTFVHDPSKLDSGAGADLERVELEDEAVVETVQRGVSSRFYRTGRFSPTMERGVHHFHRLVAEMLQR